MHLKLRDQQLKTTLYIQRLLYQNLTGTANQKTTIDTYTKKKNPPKHNTKDHHQITRGQKEEQKKKDLQKQIQNN